MGKRIGLWARVGMAAALVLLASARVGLAATPAATCPPSAPVVVAQDPKPVALGDLLRQPREPSSRLERTLAVTEGWLIRVRLVTLKSAACPGDSGRYAILWLGTRKPLPATGARPNGSRNNAVVATITLTAIRDQLGGEANLEKLVGSRLKVTGQ